MSDPMDTPGGPTPMLDRRAALVWAGALAAALGTPWYFGLGYSAPAGGVATGYGRDPNMFEPKVPWPRTLGEGQRAAILRFVDFILPREGKTPSASDVGVHELIDEWISAPYPEMTADRALVLDGLARLDLLAQREGATDFASAGRQLQERVLTRVGDPASTLPTARFYKRLRRLVIGAYYTTEAGFADIGYIGNTPLKAFPEPTPEVLAALERAYAALGLTNSSNQLGTQQAPVSREA